MKRGQNNARHSERAVKPRREKQKKEAGSNQEDKAEEKIWDLTEDQDRLMVEGMEFSKEIAW